MMRRIKKNRKKKERKKNSKEQEDICHDEKKEMQYWPIGYTSSSVRNRI